MIAMRKPHKQITDQARIEAILDQAPVLRLAMCRDGQPYVTPLNFGRLGQRLYVHTGHQGLKLDFIAANPRVCFEVTSLAEPAPGPTPCQWDWRYRSVIGFGRAVVVDDPAEKQAGLAAIVAHYDPEARADFPPEKAALALVLRIEVESLTAKANLA